MGIKLSEYIELAQKTLDEMGDMEAVVFDYETEKYEPAGPGTVCRDEKGNLVFEV